MDFPKLSINLIFILVISILFVYFNTLFNNFVWDDFEHIVDNYRIKDIRYIFSIFKQNIIVGGYKTSNYYRPLQHISYMVDYKIWGLNPFGFHLGNLLLHILNGTLLYLVIFYLTNDNIVSLLGSVIYSLHPVHTSVVSYISGRADILVSIFFLLCFYFYIKSETGLKNLVFYLLSILSFVICLLSKESALTLPFILLAYELIIGVRRRFMRIIPFFLFFGIYILFRINIVSHKAEILLNDPHIFSRLISSLKTLFEYFYILYLPLRLHMERSLGPHKYLGYEIFLFLIMLAAFVAFIRHSRYFKQVLFGFFWFFTNIIPVINIFPLHAQLAENWLYIPSIGLILTIPLIAKEFFDENRVFLGIIIVISVILGILTIRQNVIWKDNLTLYNYILKVEPNAYKIHNNLGTVYYEKGDIDKALHEFKGAIEINHSFTDPYLNLAVVYKDLGNLSEAELCLKKAEGLDPDNPTLYLNRARIYIAKGDKEKAKENLRRALGIYTDYYNAYEEMKALIKEEPEFKVALELVKGKPNSAEGHFRLGSVYLKNSLFYDAIEELSRAVFIKNDFSTAHNNLGCAYASVGEFGRALKEFKLAVHIDGNCADAYSNIGTLYANRNNFKKARTFLSKALEIEPEHRKSRGMLELINKKEIKKMERAR